MRVIIVQRLAKFDVLPIANVRRGGNKTTDTPKDNTALLLCVFWLFHPFDAGNQS